ncbi:MAG: LPS export ABC transporter periplasmic protein LptC, partial [Treponema sp.]|nr:LPS export ABC transporter periplasmic protein LptC [Treponema sp.]
MGRDFHFTACIFLIVALISCSFDYGPSSAEDNELPDVVMNNVEYVRVKDGNPLVRFEAEGAERYERRHTMELKNFSFEQFNTTADDVNAMGRAGNASVELESGNIHMKNGVRIEVESEDIAIETSILNWKDKERQLSAGAGEPVEIHRLDGTSFTGWGFSADARRRTWTFTDGVQGLYIDKDDDEEDEPIDADEIAELLTEAGESRFPKAPEETGESEV